MRRKTALVIGLAALSAGCEGYTLSVANKEPFQPLPIYAEWWAATESCSGLTGDLSRIEWFTALSIQADAVIARGVWTPPHQVILVRGYEESEITVRHEMLHDLLDGDSEHVSPQWDACGLIPS
jgi:hypothetical protein